MGDPVRLDLVAASAFLDSIPDGRWTSYGDVAVAAGRLSTAGQPISAWIGSKGHQLANVHRVLNTHGQINAGWKPAGPGLPANAAAVEAKLRQEGVRFNGDRADQRQRWQPRNAV